MPTLTREALYDLVWSEPVRTVATRFGVSDVWLRKVCLQAAVPVPERGYWAKVQSGRKPPRLPLPLREPGASNLASIGREPYSWRYDPEAELAEPIPDPPVFEEPIEAVAARVARRVGKVPRARDLSSPWGHLQKLLDEDDRRRERLRASPYATWDGPIFESAFERRRLRLLNALCHGLSKAGARPVIRGAEGREISVIVGATDVSITLDHPAAKPDRHGQYKTRPGPVDTLKLQIKHDPGGSGYQAVWTDTENVKLESSLSQIVVAIIVAGEAHYRTGRAQHHAWLIERRAQNEAEIRRRREEAERQAREKRLAEEKARREILFSQARDWRTARDIRAFVDSVLTDPPKRLPADGARSWADWALSEADAIDPVMNGSLAAPAPPD